ncbi:hypothetical protein Q9L58_005606 [Maublancomyces gigas]|uniref:Cellobiose dehydrogenase cytochrome domain-containing protein n=1 Tax=Discina gigas TaxID=1032678 RepID=A0ABR3GHH8_9PEZI
MKLLLFSILTSLVAANPILAPRAPSPPFKLTGHTANAANLGWLRILPIAGTGYFGFGWAYQGSQEIKLFFQDESRPGRVLGVQPNGYEIPLLIDRANTAVIGLELTSRFDVSGTLFFSTLGGSTGSADNPFDPKMQWLTCMRAGTDDDTDPEYLEELYYGLDLPSGCRIGGNPIYLHMHSGDSVEVQVTGRIGP